jgi:hypothetical protein
VVDEGGQEGVVHVAAGCLFVDDAIVPGHLPDLRQRPREERPAGRVRPLRLRIALEHCWCIPLRIHGDRDKKHARAKIRAEACLEPGQLGRQQRTGIGARGIDEGQRHNLAVQVLEGEWCAFLRGEGEPWRRSNPRQRLVLPGVAERRHQPPKRRHHHEHPSVLSGPQTHASSLLFRVLCPHVPLTLALFPAGSRKP